MLLLKGSCAPAECLPTHLGWRRICQTGSSRQVTDSWGKVIRNNTVKWYLPVRRGVLQYLLGLTLIPWEGRVGWRVRVPQTRWWLCCLFAVILQHHSTAAPWSNSGPAQAWEKWGSAPSDTASLLTLFRANYFSFFYNYSLPAVKWDACGSFQGLLINSLMIALGTGSFLCRWSYKCHWEAGCH